MFYPPSLDIQGYLGMVHSADLRWPRNSMAPLPAVLDDKKHHYSAGKDKEVTSRQNAKPGQSSTGCDPKPKKNLKKGEESPGEVGSVFLR